MNRSSLPKATPALAKAVWERQRLPSARSVARALRQSGRPVHFATVSRWRRRDWRVQTTEHPLDKARADLDAAAPILTADPLITARVLVEQSPEREHLEGLTDGELLREAARALAIAVIVIARGLMHRPETILDKPGELGLLFSALAACAVAIPAAFGQARCGQINDGKGAERCSPFPTS
jgi:hypothetical protein